VTILIVNINTSVIVMTVAVHQIQTERKVCVSVVKTLWLQV